jgi:2-methylcitrate dehydratase PrpD
MTKTMIEQLADFTASTGFDQLPHEVIGESKRLLLDSIGCALGGVSHPKGRIGVEYGVISGGLDGPATILGTSRHSSVSGAAFANGELMNALDFDAVLPPGHVSPYVFPGLLAVSEALGSTGKSVIAATALSHEMSYRFGKAMDYIRDAKTGAISTSPVIGYTATIFGAAAAISKVQGVDSPVIANALGIAAAITPVNSHRSWMSHPPSATIKYTMAGPLAQAALTAAYSAQLGHRGDLQVLDDRDFGYPAFIGTTRWEPDMLAELGNRETEWRFPAESSIKPYPHCRILHAPLDALTDLLEENDIRPDEIDAIRVWGEAWVMLPVWLSNEIGQVHDGQFSIAHGIAVGAHRLTPGPAWQDPDVVFSPSVMGLMQKVTYAPHPNYAEELSKHPSARPSLIEVDARGTTFTAERRFPKGSPSPEPETYMTTDELVAKFRVNAEGVLPSGAADAVVDAVLNLEQVEDAGTITRLMSTAISAETIAASR